MQIIPLTAESLGTRGLSLFIISEDKKILIDPSVSLSPIRSGLPPHLHEIAASYLSRQYIMQFWKLSDIIIQTHYHADHYSLGIDRPYEFTNQAIAEKLYSHPNKIILAKSASRNINYNQKKRAALLWKHKGVPIFEADGNTFTFDRTQISFSEALPHGSVGSKQGWVISVLISDSYETVLVSSDIMGPGSDIALEFINNKSADTVILDGPPTYHPKQTLIETEQAFQRISKIKKTSSVILDHHFLRDIKWKQILGNLGLQNKIKTLASLLELQPLCLESKRTDLFNKIPLDPLFHQKFLSNDRNIFHQIKVKAMQLPHLQKWNYHLINLDEKIQSNFM
jgi:predicted metallo-beta-lactamase superfamily hydrolase